MAVVVGWIDLTNCLLKQVEDAPVRVSIQGVDE